MLSAHVDRRKADPEDIKLLRNSATPDEVALPEVDLARAIIQRLLEKRD